MSEDNKKSEEVVKMTKSEENKLQKNIAIGCFSFIVLIFLIAFVERLFSEPIDPCECIKIKSSIDLGVSTDEKYWSKCVSKYGTYDVLYEECINKD